MSNWTPNQSILVPRQIRDEGIELTALETRQCYPVGERQTQIPPDQRLATGSVAEPKGERRKALSEAEVKREHRPRY